MAGRWSRRWFDDVLADGEDPDPRFTFANERTFLAWVRTSLALVATGIGIEAFLGELVLPGLREALAATLVLAGIVTSAGSFRRWARSERALRLGTALPPPALAPLLAYGVATVGAVALVLALLSDQ